MTAAAQWNDRVRRRLRLRDLDILLAVIQTGSMGKAAAALNMSQPAISTAIAHLEGALGVQRLLVIRNCRSVREMEAHQNTVEDLVRADKAPPLALQATLPAYRAKTQRSGEW